MLYVLDEPSIGLHQRDNRRLLATLGKLRNLGNTVLVVEHDEETIRTADYLIDLGPGAGEHGGHVIFQGAAAAAAVGARRVADGPVPDRAPARSRCRRSRRAAQRGELVVRGARAHNLKNIDVAFPLGTLIAVTGVSGSGKSTLVNEILYRSLARTLYRATDEPGAAHRHRGHRARRQGHPDRSVAHRPHAAIESGDLHGPVHVHPRAVRDAARIARARLQGRAASRSTCKGGRCETCQGDGVIAIEMHFLPNVYVTCEECKGRRYNRETLEIKYRGKSIAEMLDLTVAQALPLVENFPPIALQAADAAGRRARLHRLGQSATTLSGGEAQRVKLARELARRGTGRTLYILDEPTTGLHFEDVRHLLDVLNKLVDQGNTVVVIEHNLDVIKSADWVIDLGPEGGEAGGRVVATGTPEAVARVAESATGQFLANAIGDRPRPQLIQPA